jgi:hypothetical protein
MVVVFSLPFSVVSRNEKRLRGGSELRGTVADVSFQSHDINRPAGFPNDFL